MVAEIIDKLFSLRTPLLGAVVRPEELNPGDHIYTYRRFGLYSHHGIYDGGGHVIHFTRTGVDKTCLDCFRREGGKLHSLRSYAYGQLLLEYWLTRSGTRTTLPDTKLPEEVVNKARELHEGNSFGKYNLFSNNCEHFATFCRTGNRASAQTALINAFELKAKGVKDWAIKILKRIKAQRINALPHSMRFDLGLSWARDGDGYGTGKPHAAKEDVSIIGTAFETELSIVGEGISTVNDTRNISPNQILTADI